MPRTTHENRGRVSGKNTHPRENKATPILGSHENLNLQKQTNFGATVTTKKTTLHAGHQAIALEEHALHVFSYKPETCDVKHKRLSKRQADLSIDRDDPGTSEPAKKRKRNRPTRRKKRILAASTSAVLPAGQLLFASPDDCQKCGAKRIIYESRTFCCGDGSVVLPANSFPPQLTYLYTSQDELAVHFQKYSRAYNNVFAYSSNGGTIDAQSLKGIYVFKLHGQIYHHVPDLLPTSQGPRYLQLYFYDGQFEAERRAGCFPELRRDVVDILMQITDANPYAKFFRSLRELDIQKSTKIVINKNARNDQRVYNAPTSDEVAIIWAGSTSVGDRSGPHITVTGKSDKSHRIMHYYGCYDPLQYPILFPFGESGWHQGIKKVENGLTLPAAARIQPPSEFIDAESLLEEESNRYPELLTAHFKLLGNSQVRSFQI